MATPATSTTRAPIATPAFWDGDVDRIAYLEAKVELLEARLEASEAQKAELQKIVDALPDLPHLIQLAEDTVRVTQSRGMDAQFVRALLGLQAIRIKDPHAKIYNQFPDMTNERLATMFNMSIGVAGRVAKSGEEAGYWRREVKPEPRVVKEDGKETVKFRSTSILHIGPLPENLCDVGDTRSQARARERETDKRKQIAEERAELAFYRSLVCPQCGTVGHWSVSQTCTSCGCTARINTAESSDQTLISPPPETPDRNSIGISATTDQSLISPPEKAPPLSAQPNPEALITTGADSLAMIDSLGGKFAKVRPPGQEYVRHGEICIAVGKEPIGTGWQHTPHEVDAASDHLQAGGNVGLLTGQHSGRLALVDFDAGKLHWETANPGWSRYPKFERSTAPDRTKYLVRLAPGSEPTQARTEFAGGDGARKVEVLWTGAQGVIAGVHESGAELQFVNATCDAVPEGDWHELEQLLSDWAGVALASPRRASTRVFTQPSITQTGSWYKDRVQVWLRNHSHEVEAEIARRRHKGDYFAVRADDEDPSAIFTPGPNNEKLIHDYGLKGPGATFDLFEAAWRYLGWGDRQTLFEQACQEYATERGQVA